MNAFLENSTIVVWAATALIAIAVFLITYTLLKDVESKVADDRLETIGGAKSRSKLVNTLKPIYGQYVLPMVRRRPVWERFRKKYRRRIISSGLKEEITPDEFISLKILLAILIPFMFGILQVTDSYEVSWDFFVGGFVFGWFYPDLWTGSLIRTRQTKIRRTLPFVVDLLALSTEAGMDFIGAIQKVVEKSEPSPLIDELEQFLKEIKVGSSRSDALRELALRVDMQEVNSFIAILISADNQGAPIGKIFRQQSEQIRNERFLRAEKAGAKIVPLLTITTVVIIVPAVFLMILGPFILNFIAGGAGASAGL